MLSRLEIHCYEKEWVLYERAAFLSDESTSEWARRILNHNARLQTSPKIGNASPCTDPSYYSFTIGNGPYRYYLYP